MIHICKKIKFFNNFFQVGVKGVDKINVEIRENCAKALCKKIDKILKKVSEEISACEENEKLRKTNGEHRDSVIKSKFSDPR